MSEHRGSVPSHEKKHQGGENANLEPMQRHYDHYKELAEKGDITQEDKAQWELAKQRKEQGLVE